MGGLMTVWSWLLVIAAGVVAGVVGATLAGLLLEVWRRVT